MKVVLASSNLGKIHEIQSILQNTPLEIIPQSFFNLVDAEETASTFVENALIKARHACLMTGLPAIADDSGLCVDYLQGAPGIYSARYAGKEASSAQRNAKLLQELSDIPVEKRQAAYFCVSVYLSHAKDPAPIICQGVWRGTIALFPCGTEGFGYDPIFYLPEYDCSVAELPLELKNSLSHRGQSFRELAKCLA